MTIRAACLLFILALYIGELFGEKEPLCLIPIPDWTCAQDQYGTLDGCHCGCGRYDPDCAVRGQKILGCNKGETCSLRGTCVPCSNAEEIEKRGGEPDLFTTGEKGEQCGSICGVGRLGRECRLGSAPPKKWSCPSSNYGTRDGCHCGCEAYDPDCDVPGQVVIGCGPYEICTPDTPRVSVSRGLFEGGDGGDDEGEKGGDGGDDGGDEVENEGDQGDDVGDGEMEIEDTEETEHFQQENPDLVEIEDMGAMCTKCSNSILSTDPYYKTLGSLDQENNQMIVGEERGMCQRTCKLGTGPICDDFCKWDACAPSDTLIGNACLNQLTMTVSDAKKLLDIAIKVANMYVFVDYEYNVAPLLKNLQDFPFDFGESGVVSATKFHESLGECFEHLMDTHLSYTKPRPYHAFFLLPLSFVSFEEQAESEESEETKMRELSKTKHVIGVKDTLLDILPEVKGTDLAAALRTNQGVIEVIQPNELFVPFAEQHGQSRDFQVRYNLAVQGGFSQRYLATQPRPDSTETNFQFAFFNHSAGEFLPYTDPETKRTSEIWSVPWSWYSRFSSTSLAEMQELLLNWDPVTLPKEERSDSQPSSLNSRNKRRALRNSAPLPSLERFNEDEVPPQNKNRWPKQQPSRDVSRAVTYTTLRNLCKSNGAISSHFFLESNRTRSRSLPQQFQRPCHLPDPENLLNSRSSDSSLSERTKEEWRDERMKDCREVEKEMCGKVQRRGLEGKESHEFLDSLSELVFGIPKEPLSSSSVTSSLNEIKEERRSVQKQIKSSQQKKNLRDEIDYDSTEGWQLERIASTEGMTFYQFGNVLVMKVDTFRPSDLFSFRATMVQGLLAGRQRNLTRLIIDVRENRGGYICFSYMLAHYLSFNSPLSPQISFASPPPLSPSPTPFSSSSLIKGFSTYPPKESLSFYSPSLFPRGAYDFRENEVFSLLATATAAGEKEDISFWSPNKWGLYDTGEGFESDDPSWMTTTLQPKDLLGYEKSHSKHTRLLFDYDCLSEASTWPLPRALGYSPSDILVVSQGDCGSSCAIFVKYLEQSSRVRSVAVGGTNTKEGMSSTSFPGGQVYNVTTLINDLKEINETTKALEFDMPTSGDFSFTIREIFSWKTPQQPLEFETSPADFHIQFTRNATEHSSALFREVVPLFDRCSHKDEKVRCSTSLGEGHRSCYLAGQTGDGENLYLLSDSCILTKCSAGYGIAEGTCVRCKKGRYSVDGVCEKCPQIPMNCRFVDGCAFECEETGSVIEVFAVVNVVVVLVVGAYLVYGNLYPE